MTGADADNWLARSRQTLAQLELAPRAELVGRVAQIGDGVARITGLPQVGLNELLRFGHGRLGFALSLDVDSISAVMLDHATDIEAGHAVSGTGEVVRVPVGEALLGRVVDPLGRPLDQGGTIAAASHQPVERPAPAIIDRDLVNDPLMTGVLVVDTLFALGRGQRELIIGDRATGKTSLAVDTIINQKDTDMVCVYVAVGQRASAVERVIDAVRRHGDPGRCVFVVAGAADPPGLQWLAPFAAFTIAEYFRDRGGHALVVIDDLTKHAATHRELSLLTREPPGREAYPGDIFYLHARLLERAARLSPALGGGTLTALPIAEIEAGNLSAYIPTNLISITDGQLVLDARLFAANQRPAVDVGLSVSRVGGKTQKPALNKVAARLRLEYSQFLELEMFTRFGSVSDARIKARITRGERTRALLAQPRFAGLGLLQQVALLAALDEGVFDEVSAETIHRLRSLLPNLTGLADLQQQIQRGERLDDAGRSHLAAAVRGLLAAAAQAPQPGAPG